jgi:molybdopterin molybdotransferase
MSDMLSVDAARTRIRSAFKVLAPEIVALDSAGGRVLAEDLIARRTQPPSAVSAMDGYAVRGGDVQTVPTTLEVIGEAPAGGAFTGTVGPGQAVRIFTGGPVPDGADAIVLQEDTDMGKPRVSVREAPAPRQHIRDAGIDFAKGQVLLKAGRRLGGRDIGLAAAMNHPWVSVTRAPRISILATGDEVVRPGDPIGPNQIVSSNGPALAAFIRARGGVPIDLGIARDEANSLSALTEGARGSDLLITTGGVSVGDYDLVQKVLGAAGLKVDFWKIAMKPGKPLMFGHLGETPVLGLPGDGVPMARARLAQALGPNNFREDFIRATLKDDSGELPVVTPFPVQDSSMMSRLAQADCLIRRPPDAPAAKAGEIVPIVPLDRVTGA